MCGIWVHRNDPGMIPVYRAGLARALDTPKPIAFQNLHRANVSRNVSIVCIQPLASFSCKWLLLLTQIVYVRQGLWWKRDQFSFTNQLSMFRVNRLDVKCNTWHVKGSVGTLVQQLSPRGSCLLFFFFLKFQLSSIGFLSNGQMLGFSWFP